MTKLYMAGDGGPLTWALSSNGGGFDRDIAARVNMLESFYYVADWQTRNIHRFKDFMLDSGAYTFKKDSGEKHVDWMEYCERYAEYVKKNRVEKWFELDIDAVIGYERVKELRAFLEKTINAKCIPVWHMSRGKDEWLRMCDEYDYVAIGGIATDSRQIDSYLPWFTKEAHKRGAKVHGLGYTRLANLKRVRFDSVDSTAWLYGNLGGYVYQWTGAEMKKVQAADGMKLKSRDAARHNFVQWVRMAEDLERGFM